MTILFEERILCFQEKYEVLAATELSSRPERSVVERSAVSFLGSQTQLPILFPSFTVRLKSCRDTKPKRKPKTASPVEVTMEPFFTAATALPSDAP
jgi:hypothetical protein